MMTSKGVSPLRLIRWSFHHIVWLTALSSVVAAVYYFELISFSIPWLPMSVIGTAVAFYVGFKNNQAYDRMWEARKIWGGIVNDSRSWGMLVDGFVSSLFADEKHTTQEVYGIKQSLIYRHIAWLYAHRNQLLVPTPWEHVSQGGRVARYAKFYQNQFGVGLVVDEVTKTELKQFLEEEEYHELVKAANPATQIINRQSRALSQLREKGLIDDFRHVEMERTLKSFYTLQGMNERIKKFPLPRQYANMSRYFIGIFIALLPFAMIPALIDHGDYGVFLSVPITALIGWVYVMMEVVADYSENPFQGMANDIPTLSLCRTIEIDLREMLGETDLPPVIQPKKDILM